jgi:hypothetical protein
MWVMRYGTQSCGSRPFSFALSIGEYLGVARSAASVRAAPEEALLGADGYTARGAFSRVVVEVEPPD